jgi:hypothetical protein
MDLVEQHDDLSHRIDEISLSQSQSPSSIPPPPLTISRMATADIPHLQSSSTVAASRNTMGSRKKTPIVEEEAADEHSDGNKSNEENGVLRRSDRRKPPTSYSATQAASKKRKAKTRAPRNKPQSRARHDFAEEIIPPKPLKISLTDTRPRAINKHILVQATILPSASEDNIEVDFKSHPVK